MLRLVPLSNREARGHPQSPLPWEPASRSLARVTPGCNDLWENVVRGWYPELVAAPHLDSGLPERAREKSRAM
jgi:hypothetical protein